MYIYLFLLLTLNVILSCTPETMMRNQDTQPLTAAIVGGSEVKTNSSESKLAVLIKGQKKLTNGTINSITCTGALISSKLVITAAHCFNHKDYAYQTVFSIKDNNKLSQEDIREIKNIIIHENYKNGLLNKDGQQDDIALVQLTNEKPSDYQVLELQPDFESYGPFRFLAVGYGRTFGTESTSKEGPGTGILRTTTLRAFDLNPFRSTFMVDQTAGHGICLGDSGGPAVIQNNGKNYIIGIVKSVYHDSATTDYNSPKNAELDICTGRADYMNLIYYHEWIMRHLSILNHKK